MAVYLSPVMRNYAPIRDRNSAPLVMVPRLSPTVIRGGRSVGRLCPGKLSSGLIEYRCRAMAADKLQEDAGDLLDDSNTATSKNEQCSSYSPIPIPMLGTHSNVQEQDYTCTAYVPVYVKLPLGTINMDCELVNPDNLIDQLRILKSIKVDGVMVDCWWGIVEAHYPQQYNWSGYKRLFQIVRDLDLKLQVAMSFHECGGNVGDDVHIPLPQWIMEIGSKNPDIFFTDKDGRPNHECLTWGIDKEPVLRGRSALEVYSDYMKSFRAEFNELFEEGTISGIEIGLGPCGELRYPSHAANHGWKYPGIGEFQCYDKYLVDSLKKATEWPGHPIWNRVPDNAGSYNSKPLETTFFSEPQVSRFVSDGSDYDHHHGRFFLKWYSGVLLDHADQVLGMTNIAFEETPIAVKLPVIHWWYKTFSHAAELTAGFYNTFNRDGYEPIVSVLKKHNASLNFTCVELDQHEHFQEALADPKGLVWKVFTTALFVGIPVSSENAVPCYNRQDYDKLLKILATASPIDDPFGRHLSAFTYLRVCPQLMEEQNFSEFERFVKRLHGESIF